MCNLTSHEELQGILGTRIIAEIDQALINDFGTRFRRDITS